MAGNPSYDALLSTTLGNYRSEFSDNLSLSFFLYYWLTTQGRKRMEDGGESIIVQLLYGLNQTVRSFNGYEVLDTTPQEGMTAVKYPWKQLAGTVSISGLEKRQNSGEQQIINLLAAKIRQAEISMSNAMNVQMYADGTGNSSKDLFGLDLLVENGSVWGSLGGIDRSTADNAWWRNQWSTAAGSIAAPTTVLLPAMRSMYNLASRGNEHPDICITTRTVFEAFESTQVTNQRFVDDRVANSHFELYKFKGCLVSFDEQCTAQCMFFLNSKYLEFVVDKETDLKTTEFITPENQDAMVAKILLMANLICSNSSLQGRIDGIN